jgi:predicted dehydrogenase
MAEYQVKKFRELDACRICACADRNPGKAEDFSSRFDIPGYYTSIIDLLDDGKCQAVSCVTSDSQHPRIVMAAMERGLPVFCEKPLARTLRECQTMADGAATAGVPNLVNYSKRNAPALAAMKTMLDSGKLGAIEEVEAEYLQSWVLTKVWGDWITTPRWRWRLLPEESSAGVAGDLGSHLVDALLFLFGGLVPTGQASSVDLSQSLAPGSGQSTSSGHVQVPIPAEFLAGSGPVCVAFSATAVLPGGAPARLRASWVDDGAVDDFRIRVRGSKGRAIMDLGLSRSAVSWYEDAMSINAWQVEAGGQATMVEGSRMPSTYQRFVQLASGQRPMGPGGEDGLDFAQALRTMQVLDSLVPGGLPR